MNEAWIAALSAAITGVLIKGSDVILAHFRARREALKEDKESHKRERRDVIDQQLQYIDRLQTEIFKIGSDYKERDKERQKQIDELTRMHILCQQENAEMRTRIGALERQLEELRHKVSESESPT